MLSPGKHHNALLVRDKGVLGRGPGLQGPAASLVRLLLAPGLCPHPGAPGGGVCKVKGAPCALVDPLGEGTRQAAQGAGQWAHEGQGV